MISVSMAKQIPPVRSGRSTAKKLPWVAHHQILTVLILAIAGFGIYAAAYTIQQNRQVAAERKQFMQAKVDLDDLYTKIVAAVGEPVQHKSLQYCSYTSVEIGQGERSCDVEQLMVYGKDNSGVITQLIEGEGYRGIRSGNRGGNDTLNYKEVSDVLFKDKSNLDCGMDVWDFTEGILPLNYLAKNPEVQTGEYIEIGCGSSAKAEYFPVLPD